MDLFWPIKIFAEFLTAKIFFIPPGSFLAEVVSYFIYDVIKIYLLLLIIIFIVSFIRSYLPPEKIRLILIRKNESLGNILAALFGVITPFCTCSAIPLFLGFIQAGIPLGVTFSFLVASPMINEVALVLLFGLFGWRVALIYILSGLIIAIISGLIIGRLKLENLLADFARNQNTRLIDQKSEVKFRDRLIYAKEYTLDIFKKIWLYVLLGVGLGAWIHGYVPADFLARYAGADKWYAVPLAVLIGIPLYSNAAGVIPLVSALTEKGVALGTTLAFMMAVTGLSLPEFLILKKVMKTKLIIIFAAIVGLGIIITGYLFNWIL
jgi:hypothetical protein